MRVYVERALIGWRIVGEASPIETGLGLWIVIRRWRLIRSSAVRLKPYVDHCLQSNIKFRRDQVAKHKQRRQREFLN